MSFSFKAVVDDAYYLLPDWVGSKTFGIDFSEVGSLTGQYAKNGRNAGIFNSPTGCVIIAYWDGVEVRNGRFLVQGGDSKDVDLSSPVEKIVAPSILDLFRRVIVEELSSAPGKPIFFNGATPGTILNTLLVRAQARGAALNITWDFNATTTSGATAWGNSLTIEYKLGTKYLDIIRNMVEQGLIELQFDGTLLQVFNPEEMGVDYSASTPSMIELSSGLDYIETPRKWSTAERAKFSMTVGDENAVVRALNSTLPDGPFGREEIATAQGGTKDISTLTSINNAALDRAAAIREQLTRKVRIRDDGPIPGIDYHVGDYIRERVPYGIGETSVAISERYRVRSIVVDVDENGVAGDASIVLNDRFLEDQLRMARKLEGVTGGISSVMPGGGLPVSPPASELTEPNAITSLSIDSEAYMEEEGIFRAGATVDWLPPEFNTDGSPFTNLQNYELQYKLTTNSAWSTVPITNTTATVRDLEPGASYDFRVKSITRRGVSSEWSPITQHVTSADEVAPTTPSKPTTSTKLGTIRVIWDGKNDGGNDLRNTDLDFRWIEVHRSTSSGFTPSALTLIDTLQTAGYLVDTNTVYGTNYYYRFIAVDRAGNKSGASVVSDAVSVSKLVASTEIAEDSISTPLFKANSVTTEKLDVGSVNAEKVQLGVLRTNLIADPSFEENYSLSSWGGPGSPGDWWHWRRANDVSSSGLNPVRSAIGAMRARSGNKSMLLTVPTAGQNCGIISNAFAVESGKTYRVLIYAASLDAQAKIQIAIHLSSTDEAGIGSFSTTSATLDESVLSHPPILSEPIASEQMGQYAWTFTPPAGTNFCALKVWNAAPAVANSTLLVDDISVIEVGIGGASEWTAAGLRLFDDGGFEVGAFVHNRPNYFSITKQGQTVAAWTADGELSTTFANIANDPILQGSPLLGELQGFTPAGAENVGEAWLDKMPRGLVGFGTVGISTTAQTTSTGLYEVSFRAEPGRSYEVELSGCMGVLANSDRPAGFSVKLEIPSYTVDGSGVADSPQTTSPNLFYSYATRTGSTDTLQVFPTRKRTLRCNRLGTSEGGELNPGINRLLVMRVINSAGSLAGISGDNILDLTVKDMGPDAPNDAIANSGGGGGSSTTVKKQYISVWRGSASDSMTGGNVSRGSFDSGDMIQGRSPDYTAGGNQWGWIVFGGGAISGEVGKTLATALTGATKKQVLVKLYANHTYYGAGGTAIIRQLTSTGTPSSPVATSYKSVPSWRKGDYLWIDITSIATTALRGIQVGPGLDTSAIYYMRFNGHTEANPPELKYIYER